MQWSWHLLSKTHSKIHVFFMKNVFGVRRVQLFEARSPPKRKRAFLNTYASVCQIATGNLHEISVRILWNRSRDLTNKTSKSANLKINSRGGETGGRPGCLGGGRDFPIPQNQKSDQNKISVMEFLTNSSKINLWLEFGTSNGVRQMETFVAKIPDPPSGVSISHQKFRF